jgi:hypothetical protein
VADQKFLPYKLPAEAHPYTLELLRTKYARWDWVTMALGFCLRPAAGLRDYCSL